MTSWFMDHAGQAMGTVLISLSIRGLVSKGELYLPTGLLGGVWHLQSSVHGMVYLLGMGIKETLI